MLSKDAKEALRRAVTEDKAADEIAAAIDSNGSGPAADPGDIGATSNMSALVPAAASLSNSAGSYSTPPLGSEIDAAINASQAKVVTALGLKADNVDAETLRTQAEARLDAVEAKVDALLDALRAAGMIA